jgi:hypothetical protein
MLAFMTQALWCCLGCLAEGWEGLSAVAQLCPHTYTRGAWRGGRGMLVGPETGFPGCGQPSGLAILLYCSLCCCGCAPRSSNPLWRACGRHGCPVLGPPMDKAAQGAPVLGGLLRAGSAWHLPRALLDTLFACFLP